MDRNAIKREAAAGTALYFSKHNGWTQFSEYHGQKVTIVDPEPGHWAYDNDTDGYVKRATASSFYRNRTTNGYLVQEEVGKRRFIARAAHLRGAWTACQNIVKTNHQAALEAQRGRDTTRAHNTQVRTELASFGAAADAWYYDDAAGTVTLDAGKLLELLRSLRDAA